MDYECRGTGYGKIDRYNSMRGKVKRQLCLNGGAFIAFSDIFLKNGNLVIAAVYNYENHFTEFQMILEQE